MPRLFVAVWPPEEVLDSVAALPRPPVEGVRWTGRDQWHVTLRFLGPVDDVGAVVGALAGVAVAGVAGSAAGVSGAGVAGAGVAGAGRVEAVLGPAVGRFGNRVLHAPVAGLGDVASRVVALTSGLGRPPEKRAFSGHLTLARVAKGRRVDLRRLAGAAVSGRWAVDEVCLVESDLEPTGAHYEVLERFPLS